MIMMAVLIAASLSAKTVSRVFAAGIVVETETDELTTNGLCSLREAIGNSNDDAQTYMDCLPGYGKDTITFADGISLIELTMGGLYVDNHALLTIDGGGDVTLSGKLATIILIVNPDSELNLDSITLKLGYNVYSGGAVFVYQRSILTVTNSTLMDNFAEMGGGAIYSKGILRLLNSTIANNVSSGSTTGIVQGTYMEIVNNTFFGNGAAGSGFDVYTFSKAPLILINNIFANNLGAGNCSFDIGSAVGSHNNLFQNANINSTVCGFANGEHGNIFGVDPKLGPLTGSPAYFPLDPGSPAIDAVDTSWCVTSKELNYDQRGVLRPQGSSCDMGSYEYVFPENTKNGGFNIYSTNTPKVPSNWKAIKFSPIDGKSTEIKLEGTASVRLKGAVGITKSLSQTLMLSGSKDHPFTFSYWVKGNSVPISGLCRGQVIFYNGTTKVGVKTLNCPTSTYDFKHRVLAFTAPAEYTKIVIRFTYAKNSGIVWFDGVSLVR